MPTCFSVSVCPAAGAAAALGLPPTVLYELRDSLARKRDMLADGLSAAGLTPVPSASTYFINADVGADGVEFCRALPERAGVVAIPTSVFYDDQDAGRSLVRFAFCKRDEVIAEASRRLVAALR